jgi:hypothetical protein
VKRELVTLPGVSWRIACLLVAGCVAPFERCVARRNQ